MSSAEGSTEQLVEEAARLIAPVSDTPKLDAELLLALATRGRREDVLAWPQRVPDPNARDRFRSLVKRRLEGEPLAYLTGTKEFWSLALEVGPGVLVPRPETERVVEVLLETIPENDPLCVLDLGTGSGAIALALKAERPKLRVTASDVSPAALEIARRNGERLGLEVRWLESDWFGEMLGETFDIIVSNPPYVRESDDHLALLRAEPVAALVAGKNGLDAIETVLAAAPVHLRPNGLLALEHGSDQAACAASLLDPAHWRDVRHYQDLAGLDRVLTARLR